MSYATAVRFLLTLFAVITVSITVTGCSVSKMSVPSMIGGDTDVTITINVDSDINPDENNKPSPLFVRMYELKSEKLFNRANFIDLYEKDEEVLGADLVRKEVLKTMVPGENHVKKFVADKDTRYIALYAEFFRYKHSNYKIIFPVTANNVFRDKVEIRISGNSITVSKQP